MKILPLAFLIISLSIQTLHAQETVLGDNPYEWSDAGTTETLMFGYGNVRISINYGEYIYGPFDYEVEDGVIIFSFTNESDQLLTYSVTGGPEQLDVKVYKKTNTLDMNENQEIRKYESVELNSPSVSPPMVVEVPDEDEIEEEIEIDFDTDPDEAMEDFEISFESEEESSEEEVFMIVEKPATAIGGVNGLYKTLNDKIGKVKKPTTAVVQFIVEKDGSTSEVNVVKSDDESINNALIEVIEESKWTPAENRGNKVRFRMAQYFRLGV